MANLSGQPVINATPLGNYIPNTILRSVLLAVIGSVFIGICAHIQVPFWPVPVTMQSFAVIVVGMMYGWKLGGATVLLYLFEGAIGLPVFASNVGIAAFSGTTAGYLFAFPIAAMVAGWFAQKGKSLSFFKALNISFLGTIIIFTFGYLWLGYFFTLTNASTTTEAYGMAFESGVLPFIPGAVAKIFLSAAVLSQTERYFRN